MDRILEGLSILKGIKGSFIHDNRGRIINSVVSDDSLQPLSTTLCTHVAKAFAGINAAETTPSGVEQINYTFDSSLVVSRKVNEGTYLSCVCDRKISLSALNVALKMVTVELRDSLSSAKKNETDIDSIMSGSLGYLITNIKDILAEYIGPVAEMVIKDCVKKWSSTGNVSISSLDRFIDIVAGEVDESDRGDFEARVRSIGKNWSE